MDFLSEDILNYCNKITSEDTILEELERETNYKILMPRMLSGKIVGQLLRFISFVKKPERILEVGTYTGYSSICLAHGLRHGGKLDTIEINEELEHIIKKYFKKSGLESKINLLIGNAMEIVPTLKHNYDLIFIDGSHEYKDVKKDFEIYSKMLNKKGIIILHDINLPNSGSKKFWSEIRKKYKKYQIKEIIFDQYHFSFGYGIILI